jgi:hypothetical protein
MVAAAERMMDGWGNGRARDAHADMTRLAFDVAATCPVGADLAADAAAVSDPVASSGATSPGGFPGSSLSPDSSRPRII